MEGHVRVILDIERDMNSNEIGIELKIQGCDDIPEPLILETAVTGMRRALGHMENMVFVTEVANVIHEVLHELHEEEEKHDGPTDSGGPA